MNKSQRYVSSRGLFQITAEQFIKEVAESTAPVTNWPIPTGTSLIILIYILFYIYNCTFDDYHSSRKLQLACV